MIPVQDWWILGWTGKDAKAFEAPSSPVLLLLPVGRLWAGLTVAASLTLDESLSVRECWEPGCNCISLPEVLQLKSQRSTWTQVTCSTPSTHGWHHLLWPSSKASSQAFLRYWGIPNALLTLPIHIALKVLLMIWWGLGRVRLKTAKSEVLPALAVCSAACRQCLVLIVCHESWESKLPLTNMGKFTFLAEVSVAVWVQVYSTCVLQSYTQSQAAVLCADLNILLSFCW